MPGWFPSSQVNGVTERLGADSKELVMRLGQPSTLMQNPFMAERNLEGKMCWTSEETLLLYVPSLISQSCISGVFSSSIRSKTLITRFTYFNELWGHFSIKKANTKSLRLINFGFLFFANEDLNRVQPKCPNMNGWVPLVIALALLIHPCFSCANVEANRATRKTLHRKTTEL